MEGGRRVNTVIINGIKKYCPKCSHITNNPLFNRKMTSILIMKFWTEGLE